MKTYVKCKESSKADEEVYLSTFASEDGNLVLKIVSEEKFKVGHEYELMLTY